MSNTPIDHLADAWKRVDWANGDGKAFGDTSKEFVKADPYKLWAEWNGDRWQVIFHSCTDPAAEAQALSELSRLLGSFLDHARAALNYTAFQVAQLAIRENPELVDPALPENERFNPRSVEFPIFESKTVYKKNNRFKKLPAKCVDPIEKVQPYHGGHDALWTLHQLAAEFRHHIVHPTVVWPVIELHEVLVDGQPIPATDLESIPHQRLQPGDVLVRFNLAGVDRGAAVDPRIVLAIGIDHALCEGREGVGLLNEIMRDVRDVIAGLETDLFS